MIRTDGARVAARLLLDGETSSATSVSVVSSEPKSVRCPH